MTFQQNDNRLNKHIGIIYILFLLIFPFFTFEGWSIFTHPFLVIWGTIISIPYIVKFFQGELSKKYLLSMGIIYLLFWLCVSSAEENAYVSGLEILISHLSIYINLSQTVTKWLSYASFVFLFAYIFSSIKIIIKKEQDEKLGPILMALGPILIATTCLLEAYFLESSIPYLYLIILIELGIASLIIGSSLSIFNILKNKISTRGKIAVLIGALLPILLFVLLGIALFLSH